MKRRVPSATTLIACFALFLALGGSAIAAGHYLITSTGQIKPSVLKKLKGNRGPAGATGAPGAPGAAGAQGPQGSAASLGALVRVTGPTVFVEPGKASHSTAFCPGGDHIVSGGTISVAEPFAFDSFGEQAWTTVVFNPFGSSVEATSIAYCAPAGTAVAASRTHASRVHAAAVAAITATEARVEALHRSG